MDLSSASSSMQGGSLVHQHADQFTEHETLITGRLPRLPPRRLANRKLSCFRVANASFWHQPRPTLSNAKRRDDATPAQVDEEDSLAVRHKHAILQCQPIHAMHLLMDPRQRAPASACGCGHGNKLEHALSTSSLFVMLHIRGSASIVSRSDFFPEWISTPENEYILLVWY